MTHEITHLIQGSQQSLTFEYKNLEKLSKPEILQLLSYLTEKISRSFIMLGGLLKTVRKNKWYEPDYPNFQAFCDANTELQYRKAMYLILIYESLVANHIPFEEAAKLGYTKLVLLATHFTPENFESVIAWALPMKVSQVEAELLSMAQKAKDFSNKVVSAQVLEPTYKETVKTVVNSDISSLKTYLLTTPLELVVEALNYLYPEQHYALVQAETFSY